MSNSPHSTPTAVYQAVPAAPAPAAPTPPSAPRRTALFVGLAVVALFALLTGGFLVLRSGQSAASVSAAAASSKAPGTTAAADAATSTTAAGAPESTSVDASNPGSNQGSNQGSSAGGNQAVTTGGNSAGNATPAPAPKPVPAPTTAPKPAGPAPVITSFSTPENIDCHNNDNPMFSAAWTTTNAVKTTIAIDGPGIYKTYGPNASDSLPFNCSSPHTFKLTAFGQDGRTVSKTITLQPRNVRPPATPDTDQ